MQYWKYSKEQLQAMPTKRLLSLMRSVRDQMPKGVGIEGCIGCPGSSPCPCQEEEEVLRERWDLTMDLLRSILASREHVIRKK